MQVKVKDRSDLFRCLAKAGQRGIYTDKYATCQVVI